MTWLGQGRGSLSSTRVRLGEGRLQEEGIIRDRREETRREREDERIHK
jgi:hypothetical protein